MFTPTNCKIVTEKIINSKPTTAEVRSSRASLTRFASPAAVVNINAAAKIMSRATPPAILSPIFTKLLTVPVVVVGMQPTAVQRPLTPAAGSPGLPQLGLPFVAQHLHDVRAGPSLI